MDDVSMGYWISEASRLTIDAEEAKEEQGDRIDKFAGCGPLDKYVVCRANI